MFTCSTTNTRRCLVYQYENLTALAHQVISPFFIPKKLAESCPRMSSAWNDMFISIQKSPYQTTCYHQQLFLSGLFLSVPSTWNSLPAHIPSIDNLSSFKRHLKFYLFQSASTVQSSCQSASDSFSRFLALYKFLCVYVCTHRTRRCRSRS